MSSGTFAALSKIHLTTWKSTFMKVVQLVEGHNFHVDWHFKFWVEESEKLAQRAVSPIHWKWVAFKVDRLVVQNLLRKTPYDLCEDLQLSYSRFCALLYKFLEIFNFKQGTGKTFGPGRRRAATSRALRAATARRPTLASAPRVARGPADRGRRVPRRMRPDAPRF
jgi:hypothetical protein